MKCQLVLTLIVISCSAVCGQEKFSVEGAVILKNSEDQTPEPGTMRWTGTDFEGWDGNQWVSLTRGLATVRDIENNDYRIGQIGSQIWMLENLRVTRYNEGTPIPLVTDKTMWSNLTTAAYTWYNNLPSEYGALYNYYVAADNNSKNICPVGWRVPSLTDWTTLINYLGGSSIAGGKMKEAGLHHWSNPNLDASNFSGFAGLPGGRRTPDGINPNPDFERIGISMDAWSSTPSDGGGAWFHGLYYLNGVGYLTSGGDKRWGYSIRCLKN